MLEISIYRYYPDATNESNKPNMQTYMVDLSKVSGHMLLDVLLHIKNTMDETLSFKKQQLNYKCEKCKESAIEVVYKPNNFTEEFEEDDQNKINICNSQILDFVKNKKIKIVEKN